MGTGRDRVARIVKFVVQIALATGTVPFGMILQPMKKKPRFARCEAGPMRICSQVYWIWETIVMFVEVM